MAAQVNVTDDAAITETSRTQVAETVLPEDVENLPLNGRNFLDLALLIPGVSRANTGSVQKFAETSAVPGTGISVAGQRNLANGFIVDGSSANDDSVELAGTYYSQEVIREFQVVTSGAVAEFGRASGGFINILTQSGTNDFRGKIYGFLRNAKFDARNPLAASKDPLTQTQTGGSFGAPIIKNRTFFFGNFEQTRRDIDLYQLTDSFSATFDKHSLKFGAEFIYNDLNIEFPGAIQGVYTFTNLANFLSGNYSQFQQAFGAISQRQKNPNFGIFAQDEWKVLKNLTLNFGLRYDLQDLPAPIKTDTNNISPRFGFAYSPNEKTVLRGSFGIYYDRIPLRATSNALQRDGSKYIVVILSRSSTGAPVFPNVLTSQPSVLTTKPSVTRMDPNIENSSSEQANLQIERELPFNSSVSLGYLYLRGLHIILSRNVNVPRCASAVDSNLCRPDANFGNISRSESSGDSYYNGMVLSFNKRQGDWATLRFSYTLSKSIDNTGNFFFSAPQDNFNLRGERGLSDNDQRHRLTLSGTLNAPKTIENRLARNIFGGFQASYIFTYASRLPFNVLAGQDSTHITFGVLTAGYVYDKFKFEVSAFNGSEPDENRWNFDRPRFNSFSGRLSWNPTKEWSFQVSHGYLRNPEPNTLYINCYALPYIISLQPKSCRDERRTTASAIYNKNFGGDRNWANSFVWGQKTNVDYKHDNAFLYETNYQFQKNAVFSHLEWVQKNSHELALVNPHPPGIHWVGAYSAGYMRDLIRDKGIDVGLGAQATLYRNSPVFSSYYGGQTHGGFQIFMRFRPSRMNH